MAKTTATPKKTKWTAKEAVFIVNQSNGRGTSVLADFPTAWQGASNYLKEWNFGTSALVATQAGQNRSCFLATRPADTGLTGPIPVAQQYLSFLNKNLYCVNMTRGGSGVYPYASSYFNFSSAGVYGARAYAQAAIAASNSTNTFMVVWAGEEEAAAASPTDPSVLGFSAAMRQEIADFKAAIQSVKGANHTVCVIIMGVHQMATLPQATAIQSQQQAIAASTPNCRYIDTDYVGQTSIHFTYANYVSIMRKVANAMREMRAQV